MFHKYVFVLSVLCCGCLQYAASNSQNSNLKNDDTEGVTDKQFNKLENHQDLSNLTANLKNTALNNNDNEPAVITYNSMCNITVPSSIKIKEDIWQEHKIPAEDDLDVFMKNKTGCKYEGVKCCGWRTLSTATLQGALQWRLAVRAAGWQSFRIWWDKHRFYDFYMDNSGTEVSELTETQDTIATLHTPAIFSTGAYTFLHITLDSETLTFGKLCDPTPLFRHNHTLPLGVPIKAMYWSWKHGGKVLYDCPAGEDAHVAELR